jgi:hypothetical protein
LSQPAAVASSLSGITSAILKTALPGLREAAISRVAMGDSDCLNEFEPLSFGFAAEEARDSWLGLSRFEPCLFWAGLRVSWIAGARMLPVEN